MANIEYTDQEVLDSILLSTKKSIGLDPAYNAFNPEIILDINSVFMILNQLGVGPVAPFSISDENSKWNDFVPENSNLESLKSYMALRVRLMFDSITSTAQIDAMNRIANELEWRLQHESEFPSSQTEGGESNGI